MCSNIGHIEMESNMQETDWMYFLAHDMRQDPVELNTYTGRFVDFLRGEMRLKDTPEGLHQHVREVEALIRLHIREYPVSPDHLIQVIPDYYNGSAIQSVQSKVNNAYRRFYKAHYKT